MTSRAVAVVAVLAASAMLSACLPRSRGANPPVPAQTLPPVATTSVPAIEGPAAFIVEGALEQGGWVRGQVPGGTRSARLGDRPLAFASDGRFFAGFDRDAAGGAVLAATLVDGRTVEQALTIRPRDWRIERVDVARRPGGSTEAFQRIRAPELARIAAARSLRNDTAGWRQRFVWPTTGRISGLFGSQRIYRGEPGSYHSGLDIAGGRGAPFTAPADGVVVLASQQEFSLEGKLLIIDHGQGLTSAFLHADSLAVAEGERVAQGQLLGTIGATGRATGPHLHWSLVWEGARLDPLLFLPPQP